MNKVANKKKAALLTAVVFVMTLMIPVGVSFAGTDNVKIDSTYKYVGTGQEKEAGVVSVTYNDWDSDTKSVIIQLNLPDGVEFANESNAEEYVGDYIYTNASASSNTTISEDDNCEVIDVTSDYVEVECFYADSNFEVEFDFGIEDVSVLNIDNDFSGDLKVTLDVIGTNENGEFIWTESKEVIIAKVSNSEVTSTTGSPKKVSYGTDENAAKVTLEESIGGLFNEDEVITLEIETDEVEFSQLNLSTSRIGLEIEDGTYSVDSDSVHEESGENKFVKNTDDEITKFKAKVEEPSNNLPGKVKFKDIKLNIAPSVSGDIEISVYTSDSDGADVDETLNVATTGSTTAEIADINDNDTTAYTGQKNELDVEFDLKTTDGSNFGKDNIIKFELNKGKFVEGYGIDASGGVEDNPRFYKDDKAFYVTSDGRDDEITIKNLKVKLDNDVEPGDLKLDISGDFGKLGQIIIGKIVKPFSVINDDKPEILQESLAQDAGDIFIIENDKNAFNNGDEIYVEVLSGVELSEKPKIKVIEGSADAKIKEFSDDYFIIKITSESGSKASEFRVFDFKYDVGKLAMEGDVELKFSGHDNLGKNADYYEGDSELTTVANATIIDGSKSTVSFKMSDEGVTIKNGRMMAQVNELSEVLNLQKSWDAENKVAYFIKNGNIVQFPIGQNRILVNGSEVPVNQGGIIENDYTFVTLRGIEMAFGGELMWDDITKTATFEFEK